MVFAATPRSGHNGWVRPSLDRVVFLQVGHLQQRRVGMVPFVCKAPGERRSASVWGPSVRFGLTAFAIWRAIHALVVVGLGAPVFRFAWDGYWYERIALHGYRPLGGDDAQGPTAFFPLLPWLTRAVQVVVRSNTAAAIIVTTIATVAAIILVHRLVSEWRDAATARATVVLMLAFPASVFFWQFYTEALFIALAAGALLAQQRRRHWLAVLLAALATMTRVPGFIVILALVAGDLQHRRRFAWGQLRYLVGLGGLVPVWLAQQMQAGDGLAFLRANGAWGRELSLPWVAISRCVSSLVGRGEKLRGGPLDLLAIALFGFIVVLAFVRPWPWAARVLLTGLVAVPLCTGSALSMVRFVVVAWPAFAVVAARRNDVEPRVQLVVVVVLVAVTLAFLRTWANGLFVA